MQVRGDRSDWRFDAMRSVALDEAEVLECSDETDDSVPANAEVVGAIEEDDAGRA